MKSACLLAIGIGLCSLLGCKDAAQSEADRQRDAILKVLQADKAMETTLQQANAATSLTATAAHIDSYCTNMERLDTSACPADFRMAFRQHIRSWRTAAAKLRQFPDGFWEGVVLGAVNSLGGELDGGLHRMTAEIQEAEKVIKATYEEVERIAAKYGAVL